MIAEQQHDTEHGAEAVPRRTLLQLQQPIVLRSKGGQAEASKAQAPQATEPGPWESAVRPMLWGQGQESTGLQVCSPGGLVNCSQAVQPQAGGCPSLCLSCLPEGRGHGCQGQGKALGARCASPPQQPLPPSAPGSAAQPVVGTEAPSVQVWLGKRNKEVDNLKHRLVAQMGPQGL